MPKSGSIVQIDETACIGCTKCIQACPVDAIIGAAKQMHVVLAPLCIGCELCVPPCPVNCITTVEQPPLSAEARRQLAQNTKIRYQARKNRLAKIENQKKETDRKIIECDLKNSIEAAIARNQQKRIPFKWTQGHD